jgi:beta-glucosidase-like glycosyl hydrolase
MTRIVSTGKTISDEIRAFSNSNGHRGYQNRPIGVSAWGPNLNIYRDPRWGRNVEVPSEDPFHSGSYGVAYTKGLYCAEIQCTHQLHSSTALIYIVLRYNVLIDLH